MRNDALEGALRSISVAFCSASVGCGHGRAGLAVRDALRARGQMGQASFVEALDLAPAWFTAVYRDGYLRAVRHAPRAVGAIYDRTDVPGRDRRALAPLLDRVEDSVLRRFRADPALHAADVIVSTHFLTTAVLGRMRLRGELRAPLVTVVTDEHPHAVWLHRGSDLVCVASDAARAAAIAGGLDASRVEATGIPIDPRFCMAPPRFAMPGGTMRPCVLVSGGGCGLGDLPTVVDGLLRSITAADVTVVCGRNTDLEATMRAFAAAYRPAPGAPALTVVGYTKEMHVLMAAADVIVGKPGGLTTTEARAIGLPMVLLRPIPGQEERNAQMLVSCGAAVRADRPQDAGAATAAILREPERLWRMRAAASAAGRPRAAFDVASRIDTLLRSAPAARGADRLVGRGTA